MPSHAPNEDDKIPNSDIDTKTCYNPNEDTETSSKINRPLAQFSNTLIFSIHNIRALCTLEEINAVEETGSMSSANPESSPLTPRKNDINSNMFPQNEAGPSSASTNNVVHKFDAVFEQISYLGCSKIENPVDEQEMLQIVTQLNSEKSHDPLCVTLVVPPYASGVVRLYESGSMAEISRFPVHRIRFCARGQLTSSERECFALSFTQFNGTQANHQCHVFRCQVPEAAGRALLCFANAFRNNEPPSTSQTSAASSSPSIGNGPSPTPGAEEDYQFEAFLEMKEDEGKKGFNLCPVEKNTIKLRRDREKRVVLVIRQLSGPRELCVKKCFGILLAAGKNLRESDMHLLDIQSMSYGQGGNQRVFVIEALWNPSANNFEVLNTETPKETRVFMTIAADVILADIDEPVRFNLECKARIFHQHERFWYVTRKAVVERYFLTIKMDEASTSNGAPSGDQPSSSNAYCPFKVVRFESVTERELSMSRLNVGTRSPTKLPSQLLGLADKDDSDSDEPLLSGSGEVNRECPEDVLTEWRGIVEKWKEDPEKRPQKLNELVYDGIPDILRGEVWQLLAKVQVDDDLIQTYRMLLDKNCPSEQVILRDIHRTFPAHEFFKDTNGEGQEKLYKISKAYSLYDEEVNYCQGLSFLAAALLLHMPEEQAFCVLVKIMFDYGLRDLFKLGFDALHLRFYQLQRLVEDYCHDLSVHFYENSIETHMYASQWFLTLFTAKFPLQMVFFIVDLFLCEGVNTIFHISLALLQDSKKDLLQLDFEGILKYFRVALPRRYRTEANAKELIHNAVRLKISHKGLLKYEKEYHSLKERELESQDPLERLERENLRLKQTILRLERENDDLAHDLVMSKIELRHKLDLTEDQLETTLNIVERKTRECEDLQDELKTLREENDSVKDNYRREVSRLDEELQRSQNLTADYKKICSEISRRMDDQKEKFDEQKKAILARITNCDQCSESASDWLQESPRHKRNGSGSPDLIPERLSSPNGFPNGFKIVDLMNRLEEQEEHIRQVELELAQTKLALVEAQCQNQDLTHQVQMSASMSAESDSKPAWLKKTVSSFHEVSSKFMKQNQNQTQPGHERSQSNMSVNNL